MRATKLKTISLPPTYVEKIRKIKAELGLSSDSEVIRRAIDAYMEDLGLKIKGGG